ELGGRILEHAGSLALQQALDSREIRWKRFADRRIVEHARHVSHIGQLIERTVELLGLLDLLVKGAELRLQLRDAFDVLQDRRLVDYRDPLPCRTAGGQDNRRCERRSMKSIGSHQLALLLAWKTGSQSFGSLPTSARIASSSSTLAARP